MGNTSRGLEEQPLEGTNLLVGVSSIHQGGARQAVVPSRRHRQPVAAHQRSGDQFDDLKVLLQVLDDALRVGGGRGGGGKAGGYRSDANPQRYAAAGVLTLSCF